MKTRYSTTGNWYKGNTHIHSTASDGAKTFSEIAELYAGDNYDFLFRTDHWVPSDTNADKETYPLLWIDGIEIDGLDEAGRFFHVVCLGKLEGLNREMGFEAGLKAAKEQGAITILAHPHWSGNSLKDCIDKECDGIEIYNHVCHFLNGKSDGMVHWDAALMHNPMTLAIASDDAHFGDEHSGSNGGWIVVNAEECKPKAIMAAISEGNYYSSCGPEIHSIAVDGDQLKVETSPVRYAWLVGQGPYGLRKVSSISEPIESMTFPIPNDWEYAYLEIEDMEGKKAWTNNLFIK